MMTRRGVEKKEKSHMRKKISLNIRRRRRISITKLMKKSVSLVDNHREEVKEKKRQPDKCKKYRAGIVLPSAENTNISTGGSELNNCFIGVKVRC
jgi:hypothetical protein